MAPIGAKTGGFFIQKGETAPRSGEAIDQGGIGPGWSCPDVRKDPEQKRGRFCAMYRTL
jgi:hypothetical protein